SIEICRFQVVLSAYIPVFVARKSLSACCIGQGAVGTWI
ncbi:hypothetical protein A2U01_0099573, partial [Trifolium medium]|nr:hypothetical protein [Trifolium medium]